jgi:hypothetical protein
MSRHTALFAATFMAFTIPCGLSAASAETRLAAVEPRAETPKQERQVVLSDWSLEACSMIDAAAHAHGLPPEFFTRLIWQESRFKPKAVSPVGARGIAQFMPGTASDRGLDDPFDPVQAIVASAALLRDLREQFGNLGLAAAAYNGGPNRVANWIGGKGGLPRETRNYVWIITGHIAEDWSKEDARKLERDESGPRLAGRLCEETVAMLQKPGERGPEMPDGAEDEIAGETGPWGVQVAGSFSRAEALSAWNRMKSAHAGVLGSRAPMVVGGRMRSRGTRAFYRVRLAEQTRENADALCAKLKRVGGVCVVLKN